MEIHFEIENKCLLGCRHCSSWASDSGRIMDYSVGDMLSFLNSFGKEKGRKEVFLTGGEPLLYPGIEMLLKRLDTEAEDVVLGMFTAGIRGEGTYREAVSKEYARRLAENGLKVCYLSVYSSRKEAHDWMTNCEGSFAMTECSARNLIAAEVEIRFNSVVTSKNAKEIPELIRMAEEWGASEVRLLKLIRQGRAEQCWDHIGTTEEQYRAVIRGALGQERGVRITASGAVDILPCRASCTERSCPAGSWLWYVTFQGDIYPCASVKNRTDYRVGNIKDGAWQGDKTFAQAGETILCR